MATIKSYTDISQSKVLAKILQLESADMCYVIDYAESNKYGTDHFNLEVDTYGLKVRTRDNIPCWSLAALLGVLPYGYSSILTKSFDGKDYYCKLDWKLFETNADNPVDACVALIEKLHELKML